MYSRLLLFPICILGLCVSSCSDSSDAAAASVTITGSASSVATLISPRSGAATGSPTTMKIQLYAILVSTETDCSNPVSLVDHGATAVEVNMVDAPVLFSGSPAAGTYKCLILKMSDTLAYKVDAAAVTAWAPDCADTTTEYTHDIYRVDNGGTVFRDLDMVLIPATGLKATPSSDTVYLIGSTVPADAVAAGYNVNQTFTLLSALAVPGATTFFVDFNNGIEDTGDNICTLEEGAGMGFR